MRARTAVFVLAGLLVALEAAPAKACTVFTHAAGGEVMAGNNEDWPYPFTVISFYPPQDGKNGVAFVGYDQSSLQGGVNDKGLFFDWLALPPAKPKPAPKPGKKLFSASLIKTIMTDYSTVDEVLALLADYDLPFHRSQLIIGDKTGASAIIEADAVIKKQGAFQVGTNFRQSTTPPDKISCWRYKTAMSMLQQVAQPSVTAMRDVAQAVHQEGGSPTQYTTVYDLKRGLIHLYHFHNYKAVKVIDLKQELAQGAHVLKIPELFTPTGEWIAYRDAYVAQLNKALASLEPVTVEPATLELYAGIYQLDGGGMLALQKQGDELVMPVDPLYNAPLIPLSENLFVTFVVGFAYQVLVNGKMLVTYGREEYGFGEKICSYFPSGPQDVDCDGLLVAWSVLGAGGLSGGPVADPLPAEALEPETTDDQGGCSIDSASAPSSPRWIVILLVLAALGLWWRRC